MHNKSDISLRIVSLYVFVVGALYVLDRMVKEYFVNHQDAVFTLPLRYHLNTDMALSLPLISWIYYPVVALIVIALLFFAGRSIQLGRRIDTLLILVVITGAVSNIVDRITYGGVVDYIVGFRNVFNLADVYIMGAVATLLVRMWYEDRPKRNNKNAGNTKIAQADVSIEE